MELQGNRHLAVTQQQAWDALNDPEVLKACIPGCDKVEPTGENQFALGMGVKVGPVSARFAGKIRLQDVLAPNSYTLAFEGNGGAAGFGKGTAQVQLAPPVEGSGCELNYTAHAQVGGKIAQVGQRLVDGVAKSMAEDFFRRFEQEMQRRYPEAYVAQAAVDAAAAAQAAPAEPAPRRMPLWAWIAFGVAVLVALLMLAAS